MYHHGFFRRMYDLGDTELQHLCTIACMTIIITAEMVLENFRFAGTLVSGSSSGSRNDTDTERWLRIRECVLNDDYDNMAGGHYEYAVLQRNKHGIHPNKGATPYRNGLFREALDNLGGDVQEEDGSNERE